MHLDRRQGLKLMLGGLGGFGLADLLRLRSQAAEATSDTACIFIQLGGGASQFETYDPKPDAPAEYRGPCQSIQTAVPGVRLCELMPQQASIMNDLAVVRSIRHHEASHIALHMVETGYFLRNSTNSLRGEMPAVGAVVSRVRSTGQREALPAYVSIPRPFAYSGPHYLGGQHASLNVDGDPNALEFRVPNLQALLPVDRIEDRRGLLRTFDQGRRVIDLSGNAAAMDGFQARAVDLVTGEKTRVAFDLDREDARMRDRYGRNVFGQRLILARRLVEAGVPFVLVRTFDWDDHQNLETNMRRRSPAYDAGLAALIRDLKQRGLNRRVLVVAMGEFGRTPRVNPNAGRDHWPGVMSVLLSGGSYRMGQAIGASDHQGGGPVQSPYAPQSVLAMVYRHLGIDPSTTFLDFNGRPRYILEERQPIAELL
jgi:hypothetical protein